MQGATLCGESRRAGLQSRLPARLSGANRQEGGTDARRCCLRQPFPVVETLFNTLRFCGR